MSNYSKMDASPFWKKVMAVTGVLCMVTLVLPTIFFLKYTAVDYPREMALVQSLGKTPPPPSDPPRIDRVQYYMHTAEKAISPADRTDAVRNLGAIVAIKGAQVTHPMECLNAKIALGEVANNDKDAGVKQVAAQTLAQVASHGVMIQR